MARVSLVFAVLWLAGCAGSAAVSAARRGDEAALARAIEPELAKGTLQDDEAREIALAVAEHALESPSSSNESVVRELSLCAKPLASALGWRAEVHDAAGAEAAMMLVEEGEWSDAEARRWLRDGSDDWRAVGARGLVREEDAKARAAAMLDPAAKVRRAAMRASAEARAVGDVPALLESARVDPDLMARTDAVRAVGRIDPRGGDTASRLHDLWSSSDDALREDIARAYASPNIAASGGAEELRLLVASGHGPGAVSAAAFVMMRMKNASDTRTSAIALLVRTIDEAPRRERLLAIAMAPVSEPSIMAAMKRATAETETLETRVSVWSRLLELAAEHAKATAALLAFARPGGPELVARRARLALASDGDRSVQQWIEADLKTPDASTKLLAATALAAMHRGARAAGLLADADPIVRTSVACTLLAHR